MENRSLGKGNRKTPGMVRGREGLCSPVCRCGQGRPQCKAQWCGHTKERERKLGDAWKKSIPGKRLRSKTKTPIGIRRKHRMLRAGSWGNDLRAIAEALFILGQKSVGFPTHSSQAQPRSSHTLQSVSKIAVSVSLVHGSMLTWFLIFLLQWELLWTASLLCANTNILKA